MFTCIKQNLARYFRVYDSVLTWQSYKCLREIQQSLVEIGDKDPSFIGSREWIGAIELSFVLDKLLGVSVLLILIFVYVCDS
jgi:hypothetical protein